MRTSRRIWTYPELSSVRQSVLGDNLLVSFSQHLDFPSSQIVLDVKVVLSGSSECQVVLSFELHLPDNVSEDTF